MTGSNVLRVVYTMFLGLMLAIFIGVGIDTFYPGPKEPVYSSQINTYGKTPTDEEAARQREYDQKMEKFYEQMKPYNRNVSIAALSGAIIFMAASLIFEKRIRTIADGIMLGGVFTLLYSIGRSFASGDSKYVFMVVSVGLVVAFYLGYHRFVRGEPKLSKKKKRS